MQGQNGKRKGIFYSCMSSKSSWGQTFGRQAQGRDRYNMGGTEAHRGRDRKSKNAHSPTRHVAFTPSFLCPPPRGVPKVQTMLNFSPAGAIRLPECKQQTYYGRNLQSTKKKKNRK